MTRQDGQALLATILVCSAIAVPAAAVDFRVGPHEFSMGGWLGAANAVRLTTPNDWVPISLTRREPNRFILQQNQLRVGFKGTHPHGVGSQLTFDFLYSSEPRRPFDDRAEADIDEAYLDFGTGPVLWRVGKEKIIWGKSDLISPFDILSAKDLKDPFVNETLFDRIGQWGIRANANPKGVGLEMVWVPIWTRSQIPEARTLPDPNNDLGIGETVWDEWFPPLGVLETIPIRIDDPDYEYFFFVTTYNRNERTKKDLSSGSFGTKLNWVKGRWDTDLYYVTAIDPMPHPNPVSTFLVGTVNYMGVDTNAILLSIDGHQEFSRVHTFGTATSATFGRLALREELAFTQGSFWYRLFDEAQLAELLLEFDVFGRAEASLQDTSKERLKVTNVIGADYELPRVDVFTSTQLLLSHGFEHKDVYFNKENEVSLTNVLRRTFKEDHVALSFTTLANFTGKAVWMRPALTVVPPAWEDLEVKLGVNIFTGQEFSYVGQYNDHSSFIFSARWLY